MRRRKEEGKKRNKYVLVKNGIFCFCNLHRDEAALVVSEVGVVGSMTWFLMVRI